MGLQAAWFGYPIVNRLSILHYRFQVTLLVATIKAVNSACARAQLVHTHLCTFYGQVSASRYKTSLCICMMAFHNSHHYQIFKFKHSNINGVLRWWIWSYKQWWFFTAFWCWVVLRHMKKAVTVIQKERKGIDRWSHCASQSTLS